VSFRVATYNIHRCVGRDRIRSPARIAAVLKRLNADITALQEVAFDAAVPGNVLDVLAESLDAEAIPGPTLLEHGGRYGNAILTRIAPVSVERRDISVPGREPRGAISIMLRVNGQAVNVVATHLGLRPGERRYQMNHLMSLIDQPAAAVTILLGDFNEWCSWGGVLRRAIHRFGRMPAPPTFPSRRPLLALDRIWIHPADKLITLRPHQSGLSRTASDHLPLVARIRI
jgi:endonuclease/exonuclease/phosphatase family metal-dependent hydrolase